VTDIATNTSGIATNVTAILARVETADIVNDLTTGGTTVPLSAEQGKVLKGLNDTNATAISGAVMTTGDQTIAGAKTFSSTIVGDINGNILDSNGNELVKGTATTSAVNEITVTNAATGNEPTISASGDDTDIDLNIEAKGTGVVNTSGDLTVGGAMDVTGSTSMAAINSDGVVTLSDNTTSSSSSTGALKVTGGVGIAENLNIGGTIDVTGTASMAAINSDGVVTLSDNTTSSSSSTGALKVTGGVGVTENLNVGGTFDVTGSTSMAAISSDGVVTLSNNTTSTSSTTGALKVTGGVGVAENLNVGGTLDVTGDTSVSTFDSSGATSLATIGGVVNIASTGVMTTVKGTLNIDEAVTLDTTLDVTGVTTLTGDLISNGGDITNATAANANNIFATSTGKTTLGGGAVDLGASGSATTVKGTLNIDEAVTLDTTLDVTGDTNLNSTTTSTSSTTGALIVDGGVGIAENLNVGGAINVTDAATTRNNLGIYSGTLNWDSNGANDGFGGTVADEESTIVLPANIILSASSIVILTIKSNTSGNVAVVQDVVNVVNASGADSITVTLNNTALDDQVTFNFIIIQ
jgi:hypothetical protein